MTWTCTIRRLAACAVGLLLADPLPAQSAADRLARRVPPALLAELGTLIDSTRASGLPTEPLVQKALEGAAKGADARRILVAVRTLARELGLARQALGAEASESDLVAGASALHAGISPDVLRRLRRERARSSLTIALGVMSELIARGVPAGKATQTVLALVERGARDEVLVAFGRDVERDISIGAPPATATEVRAEGLVNTDANRGTMATSAPGGVINNTPSQGARKP
jgi:Flp pilus assembly protein TadB